jgi:hypothetical protein
MPESAPRNGRRIAIFVLLGPVLGMLAVISWEVARGAPMPSLVGGVLYSLPFAYLLGVIPALATGLADAALATRFPGPWRILMTGVAGGLIVAGFAAALGAGQLGGMIQYAGALSVVPALLCAGLAHERPRTHHAPSE